MKQYDNSWLSYRILEKSIWAPSAGNLQPWRFKLHSNSKFTIIFHKNPDSLLDTVGHATFAAIGCLMETISIVAKNDYSTSAIFSHVSMSTITNDPQEHDASSSTDNVPLTNLNIDMMYEIDVDLVPSTEDCKDSLSDYILQRSVNRFSYKTTPISTNHKQLLESELTPFETSVVWKESFKEKYRIGKIWTATMKARAFMPHGVESLQSLFEWNSKFSNDKMPDKAMGSGWLTTTIVKSLVKSPKSFKRISTFNLDYVANTDVNMIPCLKCGAHFAIYFKNEPLSVDDFIQVGRAFQRFWLKATSLDLLIHPESTCMIISSLFRRELVQIPDECKTLASKLIERVNKVFDEPNKLFLIGRIGEGSKVESRSLRLSLTELLI